MLAFASMLVDPAGTNDLTREIIGAAIDVHREIGPGLLESVYSVCMEHELDERRVPFVRQVPLPVFYRGVCLELGYRMDLVVNDAVVVEIKSIEGIAPLHRAQLLTYLRLSRKPIGLLINFNVPVLKAGIARLVNERALSSAMRDRQP